MHTRLQSNVISLANAAKQPPSSAQATPLIAMSHEEVRLLLANQLQSTLVLEEILALFFKISQRLVSYQSLTFTHKAQDVVIELGAVHSYAINYTLNYQQEDLGSITFTRNKEFSEQELADFESIMCSLVFPLRNGLLYAAALKNALRDPLTGIGNRSAMQQTLQRDIHTAVRHQQPLSVLMIDIDHFKRINDKYGHSAGDYVLTQVTQHIQQQLRTTDALFRYGGEEFLAVLPNTAKQYAILVAQRILDHLTQLTIQVEQQHIKVTASIGCAILADKDTMDSLLQRSDRALYKAKNHGRNQVQVAP